jgi:hypothetical protein
VPAASTLPPRPAAHRPPLIELLTVAGGPNRDAALTLIQLVRAQLASNAEVRVSEVPDQPAAERLCFLGSPAIRVNGHDIEPGADRQREYVHACRLYQGPHSLHGLSEAEWLRQALLTAGRDP